MENTRELKTVTADVPGDLCDAIDRLAEADGKRSRASMIRLALEFFVAAREKAAAE